MAVHIEAYDRVPRDELWECMRQAGVPECYVESIQDKTAGLTVEFEGKVGLHQGSALSPYLFAIIMDVLTKDVRKDAPWDMIFADDVVLCREDREELEVSLEGWRKVFEERGLKVSKQKTEYLQAGGAEQGTAHMQGEKVKKVDHFKYLGTAVSADEECETGTGGDAEGQSEEQVLLGDSKDQKNQGEDERRETKVVWTCKEKGRKLLR